MRAQKGRMEGGWKDQIRVTNEELDRKLMRRRVASCVQDGPAVPTVSKKSWT